MAQQEEMTWLDSAAKVEHPLLVEVQGLCLTSIYEQHKSFYIFKIWGQWLFYKCLGFGPNPVSTGTTTMGNGALDRYSICKYVKL